MHQVNYESQKGMRLIITHKTGRTKCIDGNQKKK